VQPLFDDPVRRSTGLVEGIGTIERIDETGAGREFRIASPWSDVSPGESMAVNGACLAVRSIHGQSFEVAAVSTTLSRTTIGDWSVGTPVNLERALKVGDRLGGHLVQGHVDGVGTVRSITRQASALLVDLAVPQEVERLLVPYGSITVDGVSLTVNALRARARGGKGEPRRQSAGRVQGGIRPGRRFF
jgi:riboflavin synthase